MLEISTSHYGVFSWSNTADTTKTTPLHHRQDKSAAGRAHYTGIMGTAIAESAFSTHGLVYPSKQKLAQKLTTERTY